MRVAVAGLLVLALAFAAAAVAVDFYTSPPWTPRAPAQPPEGDELTEWRLGQLEEQVKAMGHEHRLLAYLLVGNLVAVVVALGTYIIMERRRVRQ